MLKQFRDFIADERAATAIEYGLISSGIGVVMLAGVDMAGKAVNGIFKGFANALAGSSGIDTPVMPPPIAKGSEPLMAPHQSISLP